MMSEEVVEELLSFEDFIEKYKCILLKNINAFSVKLDKVIDNEDTEI